MKRYDVELGAGVGPVLLGMTREEARGAMGEEPVCFSKTGTDRHETDAFHENGFQIFYEGDHPRVEFIELSGGCNFEVFYGDKNVFATPAKDLVSLISRVAPLDESHQEVGYMFIFPDLELSLWRPVKPESEDDPEGKYFMTIGVGVEGYFSNATNRIP